MTEMLGLWSNEELCLWSVPPVPTRQGSTARVEPRLLWRAGPAASSPSETRPTGGDSDTMGAGLSADGSCLFMLSARSQGSDADAGPSLLVWDVEERVLLQSVGLAKLGLVGRVGQLVVGECKGESAVSALNDACSFYSSCWLSEVRSTRSCSSCARQVASVSCSSLRRRPPRLASPASPRLTTPGP